MAEKYTEYNPDSKTESFRRYWEYTLQAFDNPCNVEFKGTTDKETIWIARKDTTFDVYCDQDHFQRSIFYEKKKVLENVSKEVALQYLYDKFNENVDGIYFGCRKDP